VKGSGRRRRTPCPRRGPAAAGTRRPRAQQRRRERGACDGRKRNVNATALEALTSPDDTLLPRWVLAE
jgi:hypothetical protein